LFQEKHSLIRSRTTGIDQKLKSIDVIDMLSDQGNLVKSAKPLEQIVVI
jgi:hypothetical protein